MKAEWQKRQAAECPCRGADDMCACQNVPPSVRKLRTLVDAKASEARRAIDAGLELALGAARDAGMDLAVSPLESELVGNVLTFRVRRTPIPAGSAPPDGWTVYRASELSQ